jgi:hypothetical protein
MNETSIIERLRNNLRPLGTSPVVLLRPMHSVGIEMHVEFVQKCIDELEMMPIRAELGQPPSNLEKLAYQLLLDSAYIIPMVEKQLADNLAQYAQD